MNQDYCFIEPLDVLYLRGNKTFGDPGSYGECLVPPWPSVAAGALRSRILVDDGVDLNEFSSGQAEHPALGTPLEPGTFELTGFYMARKRNGAVELLMQPPADVVVSKTETGALCVERLQPQVLPFVSSYSLPMLPVLPQPANRSKPESGYWLSQAGWSAYLSGRTPSVQDLVHSSELWAFDARVGIGMSRDAGAVEEGKLFSAQALTMHEGIGFLAAVKGAMLPSSGLLRFGGDGRGAAVQKVQQDVPVSDYGAIAAAGRCCLVLTSPGLFATGWKLPGTADNGRISLPGGIQAKLVSAAVSRAETLSGWDLAAWQPKPAQRVAPTGSLYWLDELEATPDALRNLVERGLWLEENENPQRRAEGFNRIALGVWS